MSKISLLPYWIYHKYDYTCHSYYIHWYFTSTAPTQWKPLQELIPISLPATSWKPVQVTLDSFYYLEHLMINDRVNMKGEVIHVLRVYTIQMMFKGSLKTESCYLNLTTLNRRMSFINPKVKSFKLNLNWSLSIPKLILKLHGSISR